ncbi:MAG: Stk1 family PASTA domain-containing Ser/Thr kinase [Clostridia bacterium]
MMKGMIFAERYKLEDFIGQGGMSLVYRALDIRTGHSVAVKILKSEYNSDKEFLERFQREAQAASLMSHHNIVNLLDVGVEGDYRYLVLEYVSGNTLKDIIRQRGRLNSNTTVQITIRVLSALQHAHDNGIIHRDIKPQNVLVHSDGHVKVADFGIARMTNAFTISKGDTVVGSVHYSSPEQAMGSVVEASSDLYSTGVVMYEMLTGRVPFVGDTPVSVAMQHINDAPPPITSFAPETPSAMVAVVMKALEKSPKKRFQSAREMADVLTRARDGKIDPCLLPYMPQQPGTAYTQTGKSAPEPRARMAAKPMHSSNMQRRQGGTPSGRRPPIRKRDHKRLVQTALSMVLVAGVLSLLAIGVVNVYTRISNSAIAPDVVGLTVEEGESLARRAGLVWQQTDINHESLSAGTVISQIPEADTQMEKGDCLLVTISLGPSNSSMPSVTGRSYEEATTKLRDRGFGVVAIKTTSSEMAGTVLAQNPQAGQPYAVGQDVELTISGGSTMVPEVVGTTLEEASTILHESSLTAAEPVYVEVSDGTQAGMVLAQNPTAGTLAVLDAPVTLTVASAGKNYRAEVSITPGKSGKDRRLRVTLEENGTEVVKYEGIIAAGMDRAILVPISSDTAGELKCRVYLDDALAMEQQVKLE